MKRQTFCVQELWPSKCIYVPALHVRRLISREIKLPGVPENLGPKAMLIPPNQVELLLWGSLAGTRSFTESGLHNNTINTVWLYSSYRCRRRLQIDLSGIFSICVWTDNPVLHMTWHYGAWDSSPIFSASEMFSVSKTGTVLGLTQNLLYPGKGLSSRQIGMVGHPTCIHSFSSPN